MERQISFPNVNNSRMARPRLGSRQEGTISLTLLLKSSETKTIICPPYLIFHISLELWYFFFPSKLFMADYLRKVYKCPWVYPKLWQFPSHCTQIHQYSTQKKKKNQWKGFYLEDKFAFSLVYISKVQILHKLHFINYYLTYQFIEILSIEDCWQNGPGNSSHPLQCDIAMLFTKKWDLFCFPSNLDLDIWLFLANELFKNDGWAEAWDVLAHYDLPSLAFGNLEITLWRSPSCKDYREETWDTFDWQPAEH